ncbi:tripartite motif-containing protein 59 isoform X2 [Neopelma chrysocephalum]|uniref:tripartite motif-containing protein 59 isoform X2 n=1 Tax=Neopelma chrysocephalum TaxID=114329 RepID=UPI000FCD170A|nr:tripartite motif-containing protein 59 isoform X2 [Neopelma chrysocephalum]
MGKLHSCVHLLQAMERLEEELTCAVCCGIYQDPRVLPCSHTFCRECLEGVLQRSDTFSIRRRLKCPNCRALVDIPTAGLESLPINFALKAVIEKCRQEEPWDVETCREHPRQPLNIYCLLDKQLVCGQCLTIGQHHGHPIGDPHSAHRNAKEAAGKLQEQLPEKYWREVLLCYMKLTMQKSQWEKLLRSERDVVEQYFLKLRVTLEHKKQTLLGALDELNRRFLREYEPLLESVSKMKVEEIELKYLNSSIRKEKSPLLCLEKLEELQQRVKALREKELPDVRPLEICPRMEDLLKDVWAKTEMGQIHKIPPPKLMMVPRRKPCSKCPGKENVEGGKQVPTLSLPTLSLPTLLLLLLLLGLAGTALALHRALPPGAIQAAPAWISEFLLQLYQHSCSHLQKAVDGLRHPFTSLMGFCRRIVPFDCFRD